MIQEEFEARFKERAAQNRKLKLFVTYNGRGALTENFKPPVFTFTFDFNTGSMAAICLRPQKLAFSTVVDRIDQKKALLDLGVL